MEALEKLGVSYDQLAAVCRKYHLTRLAFFGSVLTQDFGPDSDVDILIDYPMDKIPGLIASHEMHEEFERLFGRKVDIGNFRFIYPAFRESVLGKAVDIYATQ